MNRDATHRHIDAHLDEHVAHIQRWVRQPSVSWENRGVADCAALVAESYRALGCDRVEIVPGAYPAPGQVQCLVAAEKEVAMSVSGRSGTSRTVFIVGAGFSAELGYPIARELLPRLWPRLNRLQHRKLGKVIRFHHPDWRRSTGFPEIEELRTEMVANEELFDAVPHHSRLPCDPRPCPSGKSLRPRLPALQPALPTSLDRRVSG